MTINANRSITSVLAQLPNTLKVIISINTKLSKLQNPVIRTLIGGATKNGTAKLAGSILNEPDEKLVPTGFTSDAKIAIVEGEKGTVPTPIADKNNQAQPGRSFESATSAGWEQVMSAYKTHIEVVDVRSLDISLSMLTISGELRYFHAKTALFFILQKRLPVFFLHQLEEKKFDYRIKIISEGEVNILIFKP